MATLGTYNLKHDIVRETRVAGAEVTSEEVLKPAGFCVVLRRPKAKDMRVADRHGDALMAMTEDMLTRISNLSADEIAELDADDFAELGNLLAEGSPAGPKTGATSSAD